MADNRRIIPDVSKTPVTYNGKPVTVKVSDKGALSLYGIRQFPLSFYRQEWEFIFANADKLKAFIAANADKLSVKEPKHGVADEKGRVAL